MRARSAERFGRKGEPGADAENAEAAGDRAADRPVEAGQSPPVTSEPSDDQAEDSLELIESEDSDETPDSASGGPAEAGDTRPVDAEVRMSDGATYVGTIHVKENDRVLDFLNSPSPFFALTETSGKVRLLSKKQVMQIVPYDKGDVNAAALRGGGALM